VIENRVGFKASPYFLQMGLDMSSCFYNYRNMEGNSQGGVKTRSGCAPTAHLSEPQGKSTMDLVLTDAALSELKEQAPEGCVLCSLEAWDEEEWD
jgi:hypothetical protein